MIPVIYKKFLRDISANAAASLLITVAISIGAFALGTVLRGYSVLSREMSNAYQSSQPLHAALHVQEFNDSMLNKIKEIPEVESVELRTTIVGRVRENGGEWKRLLLFIKPRINGESMARVFTVKGNAPVTDGSMALEQSSIALISTQPGEQLEISLPGAKERTVTVSQIVYDPAIAPSTMEETVDGYISNATYHTITGKKPDELWVRLKGNPQNRQAIAESVQRIASVVATGGARVIEIKIPPPGRHPHQSQMETILTLLMGFAFAVLLLSAALTASILTGWLEREKQSTAILKTLGMTGSSVVRIQMLMMTLFSFGALILAIPLSIHASKAWVNTIGHALNIELQSTNAGPWAWWLQIGATVLIPLVISLPGLIRFSRISVREGLSRGVDSGSTDGTLVAFFQKLSLSSIATIRYAVYIVRNLMRRPARTLFSLTLLSLGVALLTASLNISSAWKATVERNFAARLYDVELWMDSGIPDQKIQHALSPLSREVNLEKWGRSSAAWDQKGETPISFVYPDRGHGSLTVWGAPVKPALMQPGLIQGRWFSAQDDGVAIINQFARSQLNGWRNGQTIRFSVNGEIQEKRVIGVVQETGQPATIYLPMVDWEKLPRSDESSSVWRFQSRHNFGQKRGELVETIDELLGSQSLSPLWLYPITLHLNAMESHVDILANVLSAFSLLLVLVGALGLLSALMLSVLERRREIGVLKAMGATPGRVRRSFILEGVVIALLSWITGSLLAIPAGSILGKLLGEISFRMPLVPAYLPWVFPATLMGALLLAYLASLLPSHRAATLSVRETLAMEE